MRKLTLILALCAILPCAAFAVVFGQPDNGAHPFVGTLLFETASGFYSCSGTLVSPTVVLTAGHCTEEAGQRNIRTFVNFSSAISFPAAHPGGAIAYIEAGQGGWIRGEAIPHPEYNDYAEFPRTFDIGVVVLERSPGITPARLPAAGFLNTITDSRNQKDNRFTVVGYGSQGVLRPFASDRWERYQGAVRLIELNSARNGGQSAKFTANPGLGGGSCYGDSGGPVFHGDDTVVAIVSWGITPCIGNSYEFRVDTQVALDFLAAHLQ